MRRGAGGWLMAATLAAGMPLMVGATDPDAELRFRVLDAHNAARASLGVAPLRWNDQLARDARDWASHLAVTETFTHAAEAPAAPEGENLWRGTRGRFPIAAMVDGWLRERRAFKPGLFPNNSITGRVADVGHYTQMVWRRTGAVGCAIASGERSDVLVCRYSEAGNYIGERPF